MTTITRIPGGVCAAQGFTANGIHCGIRKNKTKHDLSVIYSETKAATACVYTTNRVKGAPLTVTKNHIADGYAGQENVLHFAPDLNGAQLRELADAIAGRILGRAAVFSGSCSNYSYCLASRNEDLREFGKAMTQTLQGRGGGKPNFQQGSVAATEAQIRDFFSRQ